MKVFQLSKDLHKLYFTNYDRLSEEVIFERVKDKLSEDNDFKINDTLQTPSEDIYKCNIGKYKFELVFDIDYGVYINTQDKNAVSYLKEYFND